MPFYVRKMRHDMNITASVREVLLVEARHAVSVFMDLVSRVSQGPQPVDHRNEAACATHSVNCQNCLGFNNLHRAVVSEAWWSLLFDC